MSNGGEEVLHLPVIVEAAESSPTAAAAAAHQIRKFLTREYSSTPHVQYNAIMLIRILCDNPGPTFTKNFDKAFVNTLKELLRNCKDGSTQQILRETLDQLEANKSLQEGMEPVIIMWRKEKGHQARLSQGPQSQYYPQPQRDVYMQGAARPQQQQRSHSSRQLPPPQELASRIEEARNTAKILLQLIQSTPADEVLNNDLLREFADRCQSAQRSMQGFINCNTPPPDDDTMLTLIETNEQLSLALSRHQRAQLSARKAAGLSPSPQPQQQNMDAVSGGNGNGPFQPPPNPPSVDPPSDNLFASSSPHTQQQQRQMTTHDSAFAQPTTGNESFSPPPGPPPTMLARLNSREGQQHSPPGTQYNSPTIQAPSSPQQQYQQHHSPSDAFAPPSGPPTNQQYQQHQHASDPFADPVEHDPQSAPAVAVHPSPAHRPHSKTFSISSEPSYPPPTAPSHSPPRPAPGPYHTSSITGSYLNRQQDASQGMTMHGAGGLPTPLEIDGNSGVGRTDDDENYSVSPVAQRRGYLSS